MPSIAIGNLPLSLRRISRPVLIGGLALLAFASCLAGNSGNERDTLEFRGYIRIGGVLEFSIFNKETQQSEWVRAGDTMEDYKVESFDVDNNALVIRHNNQLINLGLQSSQIARYIPPAPTEQPTIEPPSRARSRQASNSAPEPNRNRASRSPPPGLPTSGSRQIRDVNELPQQLAALRSGRPSPPSQPPSNSPPGGPNPDPPDDDDDDDLDEWDPESTPPPLPSTPPPSYAPEE